MNKLEWIRLTSTNGRTQATFHRKQTHKEYPVNRKNRHRLNKALIPVYNESSLLIEGGMIADYYV